VKNNLLIGSANPGKAREFAALLENLPWKVISLRDVPAVDPPDERGMSFAENAELKARYYGDKYNTACIADDSGLVVDALNGAPGVRSARYAGENADDKANNQKLLEALENTPWHFRTACFVCCAAFYIPGGEVHFETGRVTGHIAVAPCGNNGFGYDSLFVPEGGEQTFAEMSVGEKHKISHRGRAFEKLRAWLERNP
jgi:non-canonical purine NTP pyrophosphatase (RdgB/HAM1 family)